MEGMNSMKTKSDSYYDKTWRWIEDTYLKYFGENRTSYGVKETLKKGEISGNKDIDGAQRQVGDAVGSQFGKGGIGEHVGSNADKSLLRGNV